VLKGHACYAVFTVKQTDVANTKCQSITVQAIISYYEYNFILKQSCINVLNVGPYFSLFWTLWRTISQKLKKKYIKLHSEFTFVRNIHKRNTG